MSRSSARERRGQAEPLAALVAVAAVGVGLSLYAGALDAAAPDARDRTPETLLAATHDAVAPEGTADPERLGDALAEAPADRELAVTLTVDDRSWRAGPTPPAAARSASRRVPVRTPAGVEPGRLTVEVWS